MNGGLSFREKEILEAMKKLGGEAHPTGIAREMGISEGYAEQLARDMVWKCYFVKSGLGFRIKE